MEVIVVAVDASKEITDYALDWAVRNIITQAMDSVIMLAVSPTSANRTHNFLSCLLKKLGHGNRQKGEKSSSYCNFKHKAAQQDSFRQIQSVCKEMMQQLCLAHNKLVQTQVKVVSDAELGSVAKEARELEATWVILDRCLQKESDYCLKQLTCNIVIIDHEVPKFLKAVKPLARKRLDVNTDQSDSITGNKSTATRSIFGTEDTIFDTDDKSENPYSDAPFLPLNSNYFHREAEVQAIFSSSPYSYGKYGNMSSFSIGDSPSKSSASPSDGKIKSYSGLLKTEGDSNVKATQISVPARKSALPSSPSNLQIRTSSIRKAMSLSVKHPPTPPPLCSICKQNAPIFGKAPRKFSYREIEKSTGAFSSDNLLADGGYGLVYKGILDDGLVVAVKKHKTLSAQGASQICSEVEILSCAQHRNLVMLIGYCIEIEWLLVYEFACNSSLDKHLYGIEVMTWPNRMKVAIGAARGLRYLHEDCRVGCIVHRDFRPKNILLTHDFEPMVGDFGLARWQADGQSADETRVIGAFGYLAPEYTQSGLITEKADVYAFGTVLLELLSGIKATDFARTARRQFLQERGCPLLERKMVNEIIDPRLKQNYAENEVKFMLYAARLCVSPNPEKRPRMSKVLKILEGDISTELPCNCVQHADDYPKQYVNDIYRTDSLMVSPRDHSPSSLMMQLMNDRMISTSRTRDERNIDMISKFKTLESFKEYKAAREICVQELKQHELNISGEYHAYLQGSLAKFVQNFNEH
ncbi:inactive protein kinase SELMODRAFT_444075-like [Mercurialis annua]|uniref:inactive protein kinase SELMODRAFT_444075-like n=1 Tax=Mercurialis annua TaxID=3986 RepID=UPI00215ECB31|nr:inactive protein kinase SELMODRAFT_444075-like [Mercurialis annua]